jgi:hypothetical protein
MKKFLIVSIIFLTTACSYEPLPEVAGMIDKERLIETDDYFQFTAKNPQPSCLIFYQGGMVEELAYGPYLQRVADAGFTSYLIKSPFDLAIIDGDGADAVTQSAEGKCKNYVVAGHSLGGVVAADYVLDKPNYGLLFLAAYPQDSTSLIDHKGPVVSISASEDGLSTREKLQAAAHLLPESTIKLEIAGGNHAQFG